MGFRVIVPDFARLRVDAVIVLGAAGIELNFIFLNTVVPVQFVLHHLDVAAPQPRVLQSCRKGCILADYAAAFGRSRGRNRGSPGNAGDCGGRCRLPEGVDLIAADLAGLGVDAVLVLLGIGAELHVVLLHPVVPVQLVLHHLDVAAFQARVLQSRRKGRVLADYAAGIGGRSGLLPRLNAVAADLAGLRVDRVIVLFGVRVKINIVFLNAVVPVQMVLGHDDIRFRQSRMREDRRKGLLPADELGTAAGRRSLDRIGGHGRDPAGEHPLVLPQSKDRQRGCPRHRRYAQSGQNRRLPFAGSKHPILYLFHLFHGFSSPFLFGMA